MRRCRPACGPRRAAAPVRPDVQSDATSSASRSCGRQRLEPHALEARADRANAAARVASVKTGTAGAGAAGGGVRCAESPGFDDAEPGTKRREQLPLENVGPPTARKPSGPGARGIRRDADPARPRDSESLARVRADSRRRGAGSAATGTRLSAESGTTNTRVAPSRCAANGSQIRRRNAVPDARSAVSAAGNAPEAAIAPSSSCLHAPIAASTAAADPSGTATGSAAPAPEHEAHVRGHCSRRRRTRGHRRW